LTAFDRTAGAFGLSFVLALALPCPARAQASRPPAEAKLRDDHAKQAAQQHLAQGNDLFRRDEIAPALAEFQSAFDLYPSPKLRFNLGQCERALGHAEAAATHFERFLAEADDVSPGLRAEAERYLAEARATLTASAPAPSAPEPSPPPPAALPPAPPPPAIAATSPPPAAAPVYTRWWFWAAVGAVVVGGAVGAYAIVQSRDPSCDGNVRCY
jgi:tetratricopeptide (TPR) repeat protein